MRADLCSTAGCLNLAEGYKKGTQCRSCYQVEFYSVQENRDRLNETRRELKWKARHQRDTYTGLVEETAQERLDRNPFEREEAIAARREARKKLREKP